MGSIDTAVYVYDVPVLQVNVFYVPWLCLTIINGPLV